MSAEDLKIAYKDKFSLEFYLVFILSSCLD